MNSVTQAPPNKLHSESGQMMLLGAMILVLLLISATALILTNRYATLHSVNSQKKTKGRAIAEEGLAFALQQLQLQGTDFQNRAAALKFDGSTPFPSSIPGTAYTIKVIPPPTTPTANTAQAYQATVVVTPLDTSINSANPTKISGSSIQANISRRTLGVRFPTGLAASAALGMTKARNFTFDRNGNPAGDIRVYFGPIVSWDAKDDPFGWTLDPFSDTQNQPRKYSAGALFPRVQTRTPGVGACHDPNGAITDEKEYWACADVGFQNAVNLDYYKTQALRSQLFPASGTPEPLPGNYTPTCSIGEEGPGGYFTPPCGYLVFGKSTAAYRLSTAHTGYVLYINGNAEFDQLALDLKEGAVIVTGTLTVGNNTGGGMPSTTKIRVPPTAYLDFPASAAGWPCQAHQGTDDQCSVGDIPNTQKLDFRGFLYVKGRMYVNQDFVMAGVLKVEDYVYVAQGKSLTVLYDDAVNHKIEVNPFELQVDSIIAIP